MESELKFDDDAFALDLLTQTAGPTQTRISHHHPKAKINKDPTSRNVTVSITRTTALGSTTTQHREMGISNPRANHHAASRPAGTEVMLDYSQHSQTMETLAFNSAPRQRAAAAYMSPTYHGGIGAQISQNYANSLGILSAESYDDGRGPMRSPDFAGVRREGEGERQMPFGMVNGPMDGDSSEHEGPVKRRRKNNSADEDEEEARKKARGRPRVDTKDETAADRRRTQIRMAQRAYRSRKETTISSLEKQVQDLRGTNEQMSNIFINLYDFAVAKGLLQREPEFGVQLQETTERFLAFAKSSQEDEDGDTHEERGQSHDAEPEPTRRPTKGRRNAPKKRQETAPPVSEPISEPTVPAWGGYEVSKEDSPVEEINFNYQQEQNLSWRNTLQVITRPTEENASFPFDLMDLQTSDIQSYRVEVPPMPDFSLDFFPESQPPLPKTFSHNEQSFARRIHRRAHERGYKLITSDDPALAASRQRVFGFCLQYESREQIAARMRRTLNISAQDSLQNWQYPFVHIGGSGTYYPIDDADAGELMPKFRTGFSMGPFTEPVSKAQSALGDDLRCSVPGFEGQFFDPNDLEEYLRAQGLDIHPSAEYVTGQVDLEALGKVGSPGSQSGDSIISTISPQTPEDSFNEFNDTTQYAFPSKSSCQTLPFPLGDTDWHTSASAEEEFIDPIFSTISEGRNLDLRNTTTYHRSRKETVTISVSKLIDELLRRSVCLGRAPGIKPADINIAILTALESSF